MFAHQGGWDESLYVLVPVGFIVFLLWLANRRARRMQQVTPPPSDGSD